MLQKLGELDHFMDRVNYGLDMPMPDDLAALIEIMTYIMEVRERTDIDEMFTPLRRIGMKLSAMLVPLFTFFQWAF